MALADYVDPVVFLLSFAVGIFIVYITQSRPDVIIKVPNPLDPKSQQDVYRDDVDSCYKYVIKEVDCPTDGSALDFPIERHLELFDSSNGIDLGFATGF